MAKFTKEELGKKAQTHFKVLKCSKMYATSDGNFFTEENKQFAEAHASNGHDLHLIEKAEGKPEKKTTKKSESKNKK